jgi:hypothetical protein
MWASTAVLSTRHRMEVWRVDAERISERKIHKAIISLTLRKNASQRKFEPYSKAQRHIKMLLT